MLVVGLRIGTGMVYDAVPMIRRRIERIELQWDIAGIDDVVIHPSRDYYCEASADRRPNAIENRLTGPLLQQDSALPGRLSFSFWLETYRDEAFYVFQEGCFDREASIPQQPGGYLCEIYTYLCRLRSVLNLDRRKPD